MNLQQLRYLVSAADTGSISGAARAQRVSQPVVSRALHDLEREYRVVLFRRDGRRQTLTDAGEAVVASARRVLDAVEDVSRTAQRVAQSPELVVVATPTNSTLLSPIVASFMRHQPHTALRLRRASAMDEVVRMVAAGDAELGFGDIDTTPDTDSLHFNALWTADVVLVSPIGSDLPPVVPRARLAELNLVLPPGGSERREMIDDIVTEAGGHRPSAVLATDERSAWISSAQQGLASFVSYKAVAAEIDHVETRPLEPPVHTTVGFVHRADGLSADGHALLHQAAQCDAPTGCHPAAQH
jgi:DNA-binding transcriptional LysR family regulator